VRGRGIGELLQTQQLVVAVLDGCSRCILLARATSTTTPARRTRTRATLASSVSRVKYHTASPKAPMTTRRSLTRGWCIQVRELQSLRKFAQTRRRAAQVRPQVPKCRHVFFFLLRAHCTRLLFI
jgi:hypothetical protein